MAKRVTKTYCSFRSARKFARSLGLRTDSEWRMFHKGVLTISGIECPDDIPYSPEVLYKDRGWSSWKNFLGAKSKYMPFRKSRKFIRSLKLANFKEWTQYCKKNLAETKGTRPRDIPSNPNNVYKEDWIGWGDWLGTGRASRSKNRLMNFKDACVFASGLGLKSLAEWRSYVAGEMIKEKGELPPNIPAMPNVSYRNKGWKGYRYWLGLESETPDVGKDG